MTMDATALSWESSLASWNRGLACLAAGVLVARSSEASDRVPADLLAAARAVLDATGLDPAGAPPGAQLEASLLQAAGIINPSGFSWLDQTDEALLAQGLASARTAVLMARHVLPRLEGLTSRLTRPGAAILDVGTGVAALAAALAQEYPAVTVTGLDVSERVLSLASDHACRASRRGTCPAARAGRCHPRRTRPLRPGLDPRSVHPPGRAPRRGPHRRRWTAARRMAAAGPRTPPRPRPARGGGHPLRHHGLRRHGPHRRRGRDAPSGVLGSPT